MIVYALGVGMPQWFRRVVPDVIRQRYALKFMLVLLLIGLCIGAMGHLGTEQLASEVQDRAYAEQSTLAEQEARHVSNWHDRNYFITDALTTSDVVVAGDVDDAYFSRTKAQYAGTVNHIHYVDVGEREVTYSTSSDVSRDLNAVEEPWESLRPLDERDDTTTLEFAKTRSLGAYISHDGTPVVAYAKPIPNDRGQYLNSERFLIVTARLDSLGDELINADGTISYVVDPTSNRVIADPAGESYFDAYPHGSEIVGAQGTTEFGVPADSLQRSFAVSNPDQTDVGGEYVASYARIPDDDLDGLYLVVHTPRENIFGFIDTVQLYGRIITIGGILLIMLVGGIMGQNRSAAVSELKQKTERMEDGDLDVSFESDRIDDLGRLYDGLGSMRDALAAQIQRAEQARADAEAEREHVQQLNDDLQATADTYAQVMRAAADGDLTVRMDTQISDTPQMEQIATEFNEMLQTTERTVAQLNEFAKHVAATSEDVTASSDSVRSASERVSDSIGEIAADAQSQNELLQAATTELSDLEAVTEDISASTDEVATLAAQTADAGETGRVAAANAIDGMNEVETSSEQAVAEITALQSEVEQVDELIDRIGEIADQTNMLALDTTIEASRSTDESTANTEGFDFVVNEIKSLSRDTKAVAEEIETRLDRISEQTGRSVNEVERTSERIDAVSDRVVDAVSALERIDDYAQETNDGVQAISASTKQQAESTDEVVSMVTEAASIARETSAEARVVDALADKQVSELHTVSRSASTLSAQSGVLSDTLSTFKTSVEDPTAVSPLFVRTGGTPPSE